MDNIELLEDVLLESGSIEHLFDAAHYTIAPKEDMSLARFKILLGILTGMIEKDEVA